MYSNKQTSIEGSCLIREKQNVFILYLPVHIEYRENERVIYKRNL